MQHDKRKYAWAVLDHFPSSSITILAVAMEGHNPETSSRPFFSCLPFDSEFPMKNEKSRYNGTCRTDMFGSAES